VAYYVLEGELTLTAGDEKHQARAGSWSHIPPGVSSAIEGRGRYVEIHVQ
jgi:quercetin dioxygenase-like cupin family protein